MRVLGIDLETTGLNQQTGDRIVELGYVLWDVESKRPITLSGEFLWEENYPPSNPEALKTHGITEEILKEFGHPPKAVLESLECFVEKHKPDVACGHNGNGFDKPFLLNEIKRLGITAPHFEALHWLDTRVDLPVKGESSKLIYMAADHGFLNPFAHRAVFDVMTTLKLLSHYDANEVLRISKIPTVMLVAKMEYSQSEAFKNKLALVKKNNYRWDGDKKVWWKQVKEPDVQAEIQLVPFAQVKI